MTLGGRRRPRSGERGSAIIEAAFATPVFMLVLFAIFEFGLLSRNNLTTTNASREAARAASVFGNDATADFFILRTVEQGIAAMGTELIEYVVIYRVNDVGDAPNPACLGPSGASQPDLGYGAAIPQPCNRYTRDDIENKPLVDPVTGFSTGYWGCVGPLAIDTNWCPTTRNAILSPANGGPPDLIGVYVETRHNYVTGFFGDSRTIEETTVIQIEPEEN